MTSTPSQPVITTQADVEKAWRRLMSPLGFTSRTVWWMFIRADGEPVPRIVEVEDADDPPDAEGRHGFALRLGELAAAVGPGTRVAFLLSRPGPNGIGRADRAWAECLYDVARRAGLTCETVHLATDVDVLPIPMDELGGGLSAAAG